MKKKIVVILLATTLALSMSACGGSTGSGSSSSTDLSKIIDSTKKEEVAKEPYETDLNCGNYTAGIDIPVGSYNITATSGSGNATSSNMYSGGLNVIMGNPVDESLGQIDSFTGAKMDKDAILTITGNLTVHISSQEAEVASMTARAEDPSAVIDLGSGNFTCGTDFPAGTYNIVATGGMGNVSSDNMYDGGLNEILSTDNSDGMSIPKFYNATFSDGNVLTISGTSVQLVPVK